MIGFGPGLGRWGWWCGAVVEQVFASGWSVSGSVGQRIEGVSSRVGRLMRKMRVVALSGRVFC